MSIRFGCGDRGLWKLPELWTQKAHPPLLGKRKTRVFHSYHRQTVNDVLAHIGVSDVLAFETSTFNCVLDVVAPLGVLDLVALEN